ncbi:sulfotransferase family 2 domain-containing protein [Oceanihabitans sediminis]|uniref:sulfotransferase family 2 domain-containing protein n=1 Tax=Oceanihabitans sediminis TaxID=1812012 RepID=UPI003A8D7660
MISHKHKCIFIHISKCAGSSIEAAFGIDIANINQTNNKNLFGWNPSSKMYLQHAKPQQLIDHGFIDEKIWDSYYKFIIVRNPWDRGYSDYKWLMKEINKEDSFCNFLQKRGRFMRSLTDNSSSNYRGDHLYKQIDYFYLNNKLINYDKVMRFENLKNELPELEKDLNLKEGFFKKKYNVNSKPNKHYSTFYNNKRKQLVNNLYQEDIQFLGYTFEDKKSILDYIKLYKKSQDLV